MPTISVIVPVYNVEPYLKDCVNSILNQSFTDFELLLIDDGSTDRSGIICDEYAGKDSRVRTFHTPNQGPSAARNLGMQQAKAEWACFIDSDDWVEKDYLMAFLKYPLKHNRLIYQGIWNDKVGDKCTVASLADEDTLLHLTINNPSYSYLVILKNYSPCAKLFDLTLIKRHGLAFDEAITTNEDQVFIWSYLLYSEEIYLLHAANYYYRIRNNQSLTHRFHPAKEYLSAYHSVCKLMMEFRGTVISHITDASFWGHLYSRCVLILALRACMSVTRQDYSAILKEVKSQAPLFEQYYTPRNCKHRLFVNLLFHPHLSEKLIFYFIGLARWLRMLPSYRL